MSTIFEQLSQAVADHETCWDAFKAAEQQGKDITAAVVDRIASDRAQVDERTATLTAQSKDIARPEVVRRLAQQELERIKGVTFEPTADEKTAFNSAMVDAQTALRDFAAVKDQLRELFVEVNQELQTMRSNTLGNGSKDPDLARKWLAGVQQCFDHLGKTGRPGGQS